MEGGHGVRDRFSQQTCNAGSDEASNGAKDYWDEVDIRSHWLPSSVALGKSDGEGNFWMSKELLVENGFIQIRDISIVEFNLKILEYFTALFCSLCQWSVTRSANNVTSKTRLPMRLSVKRSRWFSRRNSWKKKKMTGCNCCVQYSTACANRSWKEKSYLHFHDWLRLR